MTALDVASSYIARGWAPVPIPFKRKGPILDGWQTLRVTADDASNYFNGAPQNVGVILGEASSGLCDVDLDCPEAVVAAPHFLPKTGAIFGRQSRRASHWLYRSDLSKTRQVANIKFKDPLCPDAKKATQRSRFGFHKE